MIEMLNGLRETIFCRDIEGIKVYHNDEYEDYPMHWHMALEIIMPIKNIYTLIINGNKIVVNEGDFLIIPPGELHEIIAPPYGERIIMQVEYSLLSKLKGMDSLVRILQPYRLIKYEENPDLVKELYLSLTEIEKEYFSNETFKEVSVFSMILQFCVILGRASLDVEDIFPNITTNKQQEYIEKFMSVCNYITAHCNENITIEEMAAFIGFSKFHFCRLFKQFTGDSFNDYLNLQRVMYAEKLLISSDISITEVAMQSGFNSISTFNRIFKQYKNCTPSKYKSVKLS